MSLKWTGSSESGILRRSDRKEKKEELFVFGYSCKLFRDDERAQHIDQGKHLIPWMGDEALKIDRYDARGALHELSSLEAPAGGYDWRVELTRAERDVEQLCDEERYRALHTNEDEEEMYKEEELKRLHAAGYGQVGFNYESTPDPSPAAPATEIDEPFIPPATLAALLPPDLVLPESLKLNAIIEKTAKFIASQGAQMEILLRAKQADNAQFQFLGKESPLRPYYEALIGLVKAGKWPEKKQEEVIEDKHTEHDEYLHPSLGTTIISVESAPSIPSIHYKPSADCDYTMLISKIRGEPPPEDDRYETPLAPGELPPPGTEPLHLPPPAEISKPPVMYTHGVPTDDEKSRVYAEAYSQYAAYYQQYMAHAPPQALVPAQAPVAETKRQQPASGQNSPLPVVDPSISTGLSLMKNYNTDSDTDQSDSEDSGSAAKSPPHPIPPEDVRVVIGKMAAYVARNGDEFADIVRAKNDPRFTFLDPGHVYHAYYTRLMQDARAGVNGDASRPGKGQKKESKVIPPVSFSIKKQKEPESSLPKPALPYESSSDDEEKRQAEEQQKDSTPQEVRLPQTPQTIPMNQIPLAVVYRIEPQEVPIVKPLVVPVQSPPKIDAPHPVLTQQEEPPAAIEPQKEITPDKIQYTEQVKRPSPSKQPAEEEKIFRKEKKRAGRKREHRSKSEGRDRKRSKRSPLKSPEKKYKKRSREKESRRRKEEVETEVISIEENSDELIDLTGELSDSREPETDADKAKQRERRRRATEFLRRVRADNNSLASAMVETLHSLQKKKEEEEERRRRRERHRHDRRDGHEEDTDKEHSHRKTKRRRNKSPNGKKHNDNNEGSDYDSARRKKRRKEKKRRPTSKSGGRKAEEEEEGEESPQQLNIDLTNTLKELRYSPTRALGLQEDNNSSVTKENATQSASSEEREQRSVKKERKRRDRVYSEGEWASSDSSDESKSTGSKDSE